MILSRVSHLVSHLWSIVGDLSSAVCRPLCAFVLLMLLAARVAAPQAAAHGIGTPQLLNQPAGPYLVSVWTDPDPLRADETHVVVGITNPMSREPIVTGMEVAITMQSMADPSIIFTEAADTDNVNRLLYAAEFNDEVTEGRWRVGVLVNGERGAGQEVGFEVDIGPARGFNWLWIGIGGLVVLVAVWVAASLRSAPTRPQSRAARRFNEEA